MTTTTSTETITASPSSRWAKTPAAAISETITTVTGTIASYARHPEIRTHVILTLDDGFQIIAQPDSLAAQVGYILDEIVGHDITAQCTSSASGALRATTATLS